MSVGHFLGGIGALIWNPADDRYLVLRRAADKDVGAGHWECVTGRVDQGEGYEQALHREVYEEIGATVRIECIVGTSHFYRGAPVPENELLGVLYLCTLMDEPQPSTEHDEQRWMTVEAIEALLPDGHWLRRTIERAEVMRQLMPPALRDYIRQHGYETS